MHTIAEPLSGGIGQVEHQAFQQGRKKVISQGIAIGVAAKAMYRPL